jgi:hypothetical protein
VNDNPAIDKSVYSNAFDGSGGAVVASTSVVLLDFSIVVTSDVDSSRLTKTLENYLTAGDGGISSGDVALLWIVGQTQKDGVMIYLTILVMSVCNTTPTVGWGSGIA